MAVIEMVVEGEGRGEAEVLHHAEEVFFGDLEGDVLCVRERG